MLLGRSSRLLLRRAPLAPALSAPVARASLLLPSPAPALIGAARHLAKKGKGGGKDKGGGGKDKKGGGKRGDDADDDGGAGYGANRTARACLPASLPARLPAWAPA